MNSTPTEPNAVIGQRADGSPWVIGVDFGGNVSIESQGHLLCDRRPLTLDEARERAAALLAAVEWIETGRSAELEKARS